MGDNNFDQNVMCLSLSHPWCLLDIVYNVCSLLITYNIYTYATNWL